MSSPVFLIAPPVLSVFASIATCALVLGLTPPSSLIRPAALPLMLCYVYLGTSTSSADAFPNPIYSGLIGAILAYMVLSYVDLVLLSAWSAETKGPTSMDGGLEPVREKDARIGGDGGRTRPDRVRWALKPIGNPRLVDTAWEAKHVPSFSNAQSDWVSSRLRFVLSSSVKALVCFGLLDAINVFGSSPEQNPVLFASERVPFFSRLRDVSMEEVCVRYISSIMHAIGAFLLLQGVHNGAGAVLVGLGVSEGKNWKPLFGTILESWSLRRFWGMCWHQALRQTWNSSAGFATYRLLGLKRGGLPGRYLTLVLVFFLSGGLHKFYDINAGLDWNESGAMQFFLTQVLGLVLEDCMRAAYHFAVGSDKSVVGPRLWQRVLGFVWVLTFMMWSVPAWSYPIMRKHRGQGILPMRIWDKVV